MALAARIRSLRRKRGLSLGALASAAGVDKGYLSRLERGQKAPSIATLAALADALGAGMSDLFGERASEQDVVIVRGAEREAAADAEYRLEAILAGSPGQPVSVFVVHPGREFHAPKAAEHGGHEVLFVLHGAIELSVADQRHQLSAGDCASYDAALPHRLRRTSAGRASALVIIGRG